MNVFRITKVNKGRILEKLEPGGSLQSLEFSFFPDALISITKCNNKSGPKLKAFDISKQITQEKVKSSLE